MNVRREGIKEGFGGNVIVRGVKCWNDACDVEGVVVEIKETFCELED